MSNKNENSISSLKFEDAMAELEKIIDKLEGGEPSLMLEESVELYKRGILLSQYCKQMLQQAQQEINILTKNKNGELEEIPFIERENGN